MNAVEFRDVDIVFGDEPEKALALLDQGADRTEIHEKTGAVLGVAGASLKVAPGEISVLMGLSGSGKSSLLRAVNGLNTVSRGAVLVADGEKQVDIATCDAGTLRRLRSQRIAMVFQQFALLPWRTVRENVGLGLELKGVPKAERHRIVEEKLTLVKLDGWGDKFAHELSGGMQQRVGLARAFATDADILLMDEPFSALDPLIRTHLQDELLALQAALNKTILFVSHDLDEAMKLGSHIAIMDGGRVVQHGQPEEIVLSPANDYVADFVAHMNPMGVLRGRSLMVPIESLDRDGLTLLLDERGDFRLTLDDQGKPVSAERSGQTLKLHAFKEAAGEPDGGSGSMLVAESDILMRQAVELLERTQVPVLLMDGGKLAGVITEAAIYRGILRQGGAKVNR